MSKKKRPFTLERDDQIIAVVPEFCAGPGWSNTPIWVYVRRHGEIIVHCIQPEHQTETMHTLFRYGAMVQCDLSREVKRVFSK